MSASAKSFLTLAARLTAAVLIALVSVLAIGQALPDPTALPPVEQLQLASLTASLLGMALLWRWEEHGGALAVAGVAVFCAAEVAVSGRFPGGWVFPAMFAPGLLALASTAIDRGLPGSPRRRTHAPPKAA